MSNLNPTEFCWYRSDTQLGLMYLGVETSEAEQANLQGPHCVFQQAALLANTEVMIQAIELWQEIDLDLIPCDAPDNTSLNLSLQLKDKANSNADTDADSVNRVATPAANDHPVVTEESISADEAAVESNESVDAAVESNESGDADVESNESGDADVESNESVDAAVESNESVDAAVESNESGDAVAQTKDQAQPNSNATNKQQSIVLVFDCATLVQLKTLSQELQSVLSVTSSNVELRIQLDQLSISPEEIALIETGAVVVIPAAYQPEWEVAAISTTPDVPLRFGGKATQSGHSLQVQFAHREASSSDNLGVSNETSDDAVTVWCSQLCTIPVKEPLGIDSTAQATQPYLLDAQQLSIVQGESEIARGSLLSYGRGSVVAVSELLTDY